MKKRILPILLLLLLCFSAACAEESGKRVWRVGEHEPFPEGTATCDVYVAPLLGADSFIITCGGEAMIVDMGTRTQVTKIRSLIDSLGITHFNIAFNTHPHDDHLGGMPNLMETYSFDRFLTPYTKKYDTREWDQKRVRNAFAAQGKELELVAHGDSFTLGGAEFTVIRQSKKEKTLNYTSAMLMMVYGDCRMLFCADVIDIAQTEILALGVDLKADVMKYPHHGVTPAKKPFLEAISPEYAVLTHGWVNTSRTQEQLVRYGIRFDMSSWGTIHLATDGNIFLVEQLLNETGEEMARLHPHD